MSDTPEGRTLSAFFRLLAKPVILKIIETLGTRTLSLQAISEKIRRSKSHACTYLTKLRKWGFVVKTGTKGRTKYRLTTRGLTNVCEKSRKVMSDGRSRLP